MSSQLIRSLAVAGLMLGVGAVSVLAVPSNLLSSTRPAIALETAVPRSFDEWTIDPSVVPIPPSPDQAAAISQIYDEVLSRTYVDPAGRRVMLSITYGSRQNQQMRAHRQEVCYRAQGFKVTELVRLGLPVAGRSVPSARMVATSGSRVEPVTYWFTMGDYAAMSYLDRELVQLRYALQGLIPDGYLVRVSDLSADPARSFETHLRFANALMEALQPELRERLTGRIQSH